MLRGIPILKTSAFSISKITTFKVYTFYRFPVPHSHSSFSFPVLNFPFSIPYFPSPFALPICPPHLPFPICPSPFPFSIPHSSFPIPHSPFFIFHSPFHISYSPFPINISISTPRYSPTPQFHVPRFIQSPAETLEPHGMNRRYFCGHVVA